MCVCVCVDFLRDSGTFSFYHVGMLQNCRVLYSLYSFARENLSTKQMPPWMTGSALDAVSSKPCGRCWRPASMDASGAGLHRATGPTDWKCSNFLWKQNEHIKSPVEACRIFIWTRHCFVALPISQSKIRLKQAMISPTARCSSFKFSPTRCLLFPFFFLPPSASFSLSSFLAAVFPEQRRIVAPPATTSDDNSADQFRPPLRAGGDVELPVRKTENCAKLQCTVIEIKLERSL